MYHLCFMTEQSSKSMWLGLLSKLHWIWLIFIYLDTENALIFCMHTHIDTHFKT